MATRTMEACDKESYDEADCHKIALLIYLTYRLLYLGSFHPIFLPIQRRGRNIINSML